MLATCYTRLQGDLQAPCIDVEVHLQRGLPGINIIGLPETVVKESRDRVRSAIVQSGFTMPTRKLTINLAPADLPKLGTHYDLAIAIGVLVSSGQINVKTDHVELYGELALSGQLRSAKGLLAALTQGQKKTLIVPFENQENLSIIEDADIKVAHNLLDVVHFLQGSKQLQSPTKEEKNECSKKPAVEWQNIRGQEIARRAMVYAACGGHSMLMFGPPGCGKSLLAQALPGILPKLSNQQRLRVAAIHSICRTQDMELSNEFAPFRSPHHTSSAVALIGGGSYPQPGEISLAHHGVLFLDELPEFKREALEAMREPLETGKISISRAHSKAVFPANCQLITAMNPCPCGFLGERRCSCTEEQVKRYRHKLSGPLLDRIDMHVEMHPIRTEDLMSLPSSSQSSSDIRKVVERVRKVQLKRQNKLNSDLSVAELDQIIELEKPAKELLEKAMNRLNLSARAYHRIIRLSRTIADSHQHLTIQTTDISQAISYRQLDRTVV